MRVKAAVCHEANHPLVVEDVELDGPRDGEVMVRWGASGVCGSDLHIIRGAAGWPMPFILGHEGAGVVAEVGPKVSRVQVGDHVVSDLLGACGECRFCTSGRPRLCEPQRARSVPDVESRFHKDSQRIGRFGHHEIATFVECAVVPERSLTVIRKDVPLDAACLLGCCALSGAGAVISRAEVGVGSRVTVFGCGGLGLSAINAASLSGAAQVIGDDLVSRKLEWAREFGATDVIDASRENTVARINEVTDGELADYAFEFTGSPEVTRHAIAAVRRGGMVVLEGVNPGAVIQIDQGELVDNEKVITGAHAGGAIPGRDVARLIDLFIDGRFKLADLISHRVSLDDVNQAFDLLVSGESKRSVVIFP